MNKVPDSTKRRRFLSLALLISFAAAFAGIASHFLSSPPGVPVYSARYDAARDAFQDSRDALSLAKSTRRRVLIMIGGEWCTWCHHFATTVDHHPDIRQALNTQFVLLKINVSAENDNAAFLGGLPRFTGYPHFFVAENTGTILISQNPSEFVENGRYSPDRIRKFLANAGTRRDSSS